MNTSMLEYWLQGPVTGVPALLQPAAHALLQAKREINELMQEYPDSLLWDQPAGVASPAFHLQHIAGVLNRLFTYANSNPLNSEQLAYLSSEGKYNDQITVSMLVSNLNKQIDIAVHMLTQTDDSKLTQTRYVGRRQIPSTQIGLLFHAAEHTMRHNGQLQVTVKIILKKQA